MKRITPIILLAAALFAPLSMRAQVDKQVEVTKAYVPSVERATKLAVAPNMVDTVTMQPDIDYTITPLSLKTNLATAPIRPATVTYWEFNRPLPFYLKVGAGYPLNTALDFYASTQNPGTGYALAYVNHDGSYSKIRNDFGEKHNSTQLFNRIGAAAGKYVGRHVLEAEVNYTDRLTHAYGALQGVFIPADNPAVFTPGQAIRSGVGELRVRMGDDFLDLERLNFNVELYGSLFREYEVRQAGQYTVGADFSLGKRFGRHLFRLDLGGERWDRTKGSDYTDLVIRAGARYGYRGRGIDLVAGLDYCYDKVETAGSRISNYVLPYARLRFDLGQGYFVPFVELDGEWHNYSYESLTLLNPYTLYGTDLPKNGVDYNLRLGVDGNILGEKVAYRAYFGVTLAPDHLYWRAVALPDGGLSFEPERGRQTVASINVEVEYKPISRLHFSLGLHACQYRDTEDLEWCYDPAKAVCERRSWGNGEPAFRADAGMRYRGRKISFGIRADMQSVRSWSVWRPWSSSTGGGSSVQQWVGSATGTVSTQEYYPPMFRVPFTVDLCADFDWHVSNRVTIFAEGRNLCNSGLYRWAFFPELGANFTAGVKIQF